MAVRQELAITLYAHEILSFGKGRTVAGLSKRAFHELLGEREILRHYTEAELAEDIDYAE